jgi:antitoxin component YwqK of YwqJK toxin-antitoxin module
MRILNLVFFIALTSNIAVQAQTRTTMSEATYALKGPVQTFRTEVATFVLKDGQYVEGPRVVETTASFNEDGNRTDLGIYNKGALVRRIEMKFEGRTLVEYMNYDGAGGMWLRGTNILDDDGQIKEKATYNGDGSLRSRTFFKRDKQGQILEMAEYSANGTLMERISNTFNGAERKMSYRSIYRHDGSLQTTEVRDMAKKSVETVVYNPNGSVATTSLRVDREIAEYSKDGSIQKTTAISTQGRLLDEVMFSEDRPIKRESQVPDEIDSHGNWIKQTKWVTDANGTRPLKVTYRTITYYRKFVF